MNHDDCIVCVVLRSLRHEEDGVQEPTVAREVLLLLRVQDADRHQVVHPARAGHLLFRLLRGEVRHSMRQVLQGICPCHRAPFFAFLGPFNNQDKPHLSPEAFVLNLTVLLKSSVDCFDAKVEASTPH